MLLIFPRERSGDSKRVHRGATSNNLSKMSSKSSIGASISNDRSLSESEMAKAVRVLPNFNT